MKKHVFQVLLGILTSPMGGLTDGTKIGTGEKIVIFLNIMRGILIVMVYLYGIFVALYHTSTYILTYG